MQVLIRIMVAACSVFGLAVACQHGQGQSDLATPGEMAATRGGADCFTVFPKGCSVNNSPLTCAGTDCGNQGGQWACPSGAGQVDVGGPFFACQASPALQTGYTGSTPLTNPTCATQYTCPTSGCTPTSDPNVRKCAAPSNGTPIGQTAVSACTGGSQDCRNRD